MKSLKVSFVVVLALAASSAACGFSGRSGSDGGSGDGGFNPADGGGLGDGGWTEAVWPVKPASWTSDAKKAPKYIHMTYQHATDTTVTIQWEADVSSKSSLVPKVWAVKASEARDSGGETEIPYAAQYSYEGTGLQYEAFLDDQTRKFVLWSVELTGLEPNTKYFYRAGTWDSFDFGSKEFSNPTLSPVYSFFTAPKKGSGDQFSFVLAGDCRDGNESIKANMKTYTDLGTDLWLFNGDMTSAGTKSEWNAWFDVMQPLMTQTVLMPVQGNHEVVSDLFYNQFSLPVMPGLPDNIKENAWSFDYGTVHFVGLNSLTESLVQAQSAWLESDLKAARADTAIKFIIVMFHHPAYSASPSHGSTQRVQQYWVPIFEKYNVDMTISGHDHDYERSFPIRGNQKAAEGQGVVHVVAGSFWAPPYSNGSDWWTATSHHGSSGNFVVVDVKGGTMSARVLSGDGTQVLDTFTFSR